MGSISTDRTRQRGILIPDSWVRSPVSLSCAAKPTPQIIRLVVPELSVTPYVSVDITSVVKSSPSYVYALYFAQTNYVKRRERESVEYQTKRGHGRINFAFAFRNMCCWVTVQ